VITFAKNGGKLMAKRIEVRIAGLGGQGVVLAGQILGRAAVYDGKSVVQTQSYGAEARGSAAKSEVIISDNKIAFPMVRKCDILVAMSQQALDKYISDLKGNGILLVDTLIKKIPETEAKLFKVPATKTAEKTLGNKLYANVVMLGALIKETRITSLEAMEKAIRESVPEKVREANLNAFKEGLKLG
jgi:2-oxoglutarate ferredoxin oxidoreductase subunit gamma